MADHRDDDTLRLNTMYFVVNGDALVKSAKIVTFALQVFSDLQVVHPMIYNRYESRK